MSAECNIKSLEFHPHFRRDVTGRFDGGRITSDGGGLLLREVEQRAKIIEQFARCFTDYRNPILVEHSVRELVAQRVYGLALGYGDLNDHDELRADVLRAVLVGKDDPEGKRRFRRRVLSKSSCMGRARVGPGCDE